MKTCERDATSNTTRSRVYPRRLDAGGATPTALRPARHQHTPTPAAPGSYAPHIVSCDWIALAIRLGRAAFGLQLAAVRPPAVALQPLFVSSQLAGFALPLACVARWPLLPAASLRLAHSVVWPVLALALAHIGRRGCAD